MNNKFTLIFLLSSLLSTAPALAKKADISQHKNIIISNLGKEKNAIDTHIKCIKSASLKKEIKACGKERRNFMKNLRKEQKSELKALRKKD